MKDYNQQSLRKNVEPIVFTLKQYVDAPGDGTDWKKSMAGIKGLWNSIYPQNPFDYFFMDDHFNAQYKNDEQFGKVFTLFAGLAIFIAALGLFGLTAYMTSMRTKEIGVRKVLGASVSNIIALLTTNFLKPVAIAM